MNFGEKLDNKLVCIWDIVHACLPHLFGDGISGLYTNVIIIDQINETIFIVVWIISDCLAMA